MSESETKTIGVKRKDGKFFQVANSIIDDWGPVIGSDGVSIYCLLERKSNSETGTAWMGHDWIAERLCISTDTVGTVLGDLEELGLVTVDRQRDPSTGQIKRSLYTVVEPAPACTVKAEDAPRVKRAEARKAKKAAIQSVQISKAHTVQFSKANTELSSKPTPNNSVQPDLTIRQYKDSVSSDKDSILLDKDSKGEAALAASQPLAAPPAPSVQPVTEKEKPPKTPRPGKAVKETPEETAYYRSCVPFVAQACNLDLNIDGVWGQCKKPLQALYHAETRPTPELIEREFVADTGFWRLVHWKGKRGEYPEPHEFPGNWKRAMTWRDKPALAVVSGGGNRSRGTPGANGDPSIDYLAIAIEQEKRRTSGQVIDGRFVNG